MEQVANAQSHKALTLNTIAFTVCFAAWMMNAFWSRFWPPTRCSTGVPSKLVGSWVFRY